MIFNKDVTAVPPEGGQEQKMILLSDCGMEIPYVSTPDIVDAIFSIWCKSDSNGTINVAVGSYTENISVSTSWNRIVISTTEFSNTDKIIVTVGASIQVYFYKAQLEGGTKVSDWTPALEDIDSNINKVQNDATNAETTATNAEKNANKALQVTKQVETYFSFETTGLDVHTVDSAYSMRIATDGYEVRQKIETGEIRVRQKVKGAATISPEYRVGEPSSTGKMFGMRVAPDGGIMFGLED